MKNSPEQIHIQQVTWAQAKSDLRAVRTVVFIEEQLVTPEFEWDELDKEAIHLLAFVQDQPVGCLRIIGQQKIGRMAVLKGWRGRGIGMALLQKAIATCKALGSPYVKLSAQTHAIGFYQSAGFRVVSEEYCDVHIPHVDMHLEIQA